MRYVNRVYLFCKNYIKNYNPLKILFSSRCESVWRSKVKSTLQSFDIRNCNYCVTNELFNNRDKREGNAIYNYLEIPIAYDMMVAQWIQYDPHHFQFMLSIN